MVCIIYALFLGSEGDNDYCAAHFINNGIEVYGQSVKIQFHGTQSSISYYMCKLDSNPFVRCKSVYTLTVHPNSHNSAPLYRLFFKVALAPYGSYNVHTCPHNNIFYLGMQECFWKKNPLIFHSAGRSPYRLEDLEPGEHRIKIYPVCVSHDQRSYRVTARFTVQWAT